MNTLSITTQDGEVFTATFHQENKGWYIDQNGHSHVFVPYSRSFKVNDIDYTATTGAEALRIGRIMIRLNDEAFSDFEKNHPELNP